MRSALALLLPAIGVVLVSSDAHALPNAPDAFCVRYPDVPACAGTRPACTFCHTTPPARNVFGAELSSSLAAGAPRPLEARAFVDGLGPALAAIEAGDADGDGSSNLDEIRAGTLPGDPTSVPRAGRCPTPEERIGYDPCGQDARFALRRVMISFCGTSPTLETYRALASAPDPLAYVDATLRSCLHSENWRARDGVVWNVANRKIKPQRSIKAGDEAGDVPVGDYFDDYNLFVYTQIDDHDARDLWTARYHVGRRDGTVTSYTPYTRSDQEEIDQRGFLVAQKVPIDRRAGMLTTQWFLLSNTMFTAVPRTTAAQAYRAYLGYDIAKTEGLFAIDGEPVDYDGKGVRAPECAGCHATLDPLAYPFAFYSGLGGEEGGAARGGSYVPDRPSRFVYLNGPDMAKLPESGAVLGKPVADLRAWAATAASSDAFAKATVLDYWKLLLGGPPTPAQQREFDELARAFAPTHDYRVERMLGALVRTEAYLVP